MRIPFIITGLISGAIYGLTAVGLVLTYKTSSDAVYLLNQGTVTFSGPPTELDEATVVRRYLGVDGDQ